MKSSVKRKGRLSAMLLMSAIVLAACGSDNDSSPAPPPGASAPPPAADNSVPASAGNSVAAYIAYLRGLPTDEMSSPVDVGSFVAPIDDTASATPLGS